MKKPRKNPPQMTILDLMETQEIRFSTYPYYWDKQKAKWADSPTIRPLLKYRLVEVSAPLDVGGKIYQVHVTIFAGHSAVIFRGINKKRWKVPILCFDGEGLCGELFEWRDKAGLEPKQSSVQKFHDAHPDEKEAILFENLDEALADPFCDTTSDLACRLEVLSLIESLPEVHLK